MMREKVRQKEGEQPNEKETQQLGPEPQKDLFSSAALDRAPASQRCACVLESSFPTPTPRLRDSVERAAPAQPE